MESTSRPSLVTQSASCPLVTQSTSCPLVTQSTWEPASFTPHVELQQRSVSLVALPPLLRFLARLRVLVLLHFLLSASVIYLQVSALAFDFWRELHVNRAAMLLLWRLGQLPATLLNQTISFSRAQGVYEECVLESRLDVMNVTDPFPRPRCYSMFAEVQMIEHGGFRRSLGIVSAQMYLGPFVLLSSLFCLGLLFLAANSSAFRRVMRLCAAVRVAGIGLSLALLVCALQLQAALGSPGAAYPVVWPAAIQGRTRLRAWRVGQVNWAVAMGLQFALIGFDFHHSRLPEADRAEFAYARAVAALEA